MEIEDLAKQVALLRDTVIELKKNLDTSQDSILKIITPVLDYIEHMAIRNSISIETIYKLFDDNKTFPEEEIDKDIKYITKEYEKRYKEMTDKIEKAAEEEKNKE